MANQEPSLWSNRVEQVLLGRKSKKKKVLKYIHILEAGHLLKGLDLQRLLCYFSQRIWGHFLFVIPDAILAAVFRPSRKSFLNLLCLYHLLSFLHSNSWRKPGTKQAGAYQSGTFKHVYLQIIRELGKRPQRKLPDGVQTGSFSPSSQRQRPRSCCQVRWCRQPLAGLQRVTWRLKMCDCSQGPNLFRGGGIQSGSFSSSRTETGLFSERPAVIQCISEIKASPHSCLMLTDSWKNCLGVDLGGSFPSLLLYLFHKFSFFAASRFLSNPWAGPSSLLSLLT